MTSFGFLKINEEKDDWTLTVEGEPLQTLTTEEAKELVNQQGWIDRFAGLGTIELFAQA